MQVIGNMYMTSTDCRDSRGQPGTLTTTAGTAGDTDNVQGQQCQLTDLETVLDRVKSRHPHSVAPWSEEVTM